MGWEAHSVAEQFSNGRVLPGDTHHKKRVTEEKDWKDAGVNIENHSLYGE